MSVDRSMRNAFASLLLVAAVFLAMNRIVSSAPLEDWWLPLVLVIVGAALLPNWDFSRSRPDREDDAPSLSAPGVQSYSVSEKVVPRLHTMTIRPDPEASEYVVTVTNDATGDVLPFMEAIPTPTPQSEETPTPILIPEPSSEPTPTSPETPTPNAPAEPTVESPETPTPDAPTEVVKNGPSQELPVNLVPDLSQPAPDVKFTAHTEYADPDNAVAKKEAPATPPPTDAVTAPQRTELEKEVVAEKTAAPQQPYEVAQIGTITPEQASRVMDASTGEANIPAMSQPASASVTAQEVNGEGVVGSADDLTKLSGVGAKSAAALKAAGIDSFNKLANSSGDAIRAALTTGGVRLVGDVNTWTQQAAYAARGDWDGLKQFNAGRKATNGD